MSDDLSLIEPVLEKWGKRILDVLERSANNPPLLGIELISLGAAVKMIPQLDMIVWDFSGKHVPPVNVQNQPPKDPTKPPPPNIVDTIWQSIVGSEQIAFGSLFGNSQTVMSGVQLDPATNSAAQTITKDLPNLLSLLGINLPAQITLSEVLILGGILLMAEPLLKSVAGSLSGLLGSAFKIG